MARAFFTARENAEAHTLGFPLPDPRNTQDRPYYQKVDYLNCTLAKRLRALREQAGAAPAPDIPATLAEQSPALVNAATDEPPSTIFLAETTPDLVPLHDNLTRQLDQSGLTLLPPAYYARDPEAFAYWALKRWVRPKHPSSAFIGHYVSNGHSAGVSIFCCDIG